VPSYEEGAVSDTHDVIMAAYPASETAEKDFDELVRLVKEKKVRTEGVILVEHDEDGRVTVHRTGDHLGRKGLGWGGGVGLLVGLFSPPLLGSIVVGAAAGGLIGKFAQHRVDSGMESGLGEKLEEGQAAIIAMVDSDDLPVAESVITTPAKSVVQMDKKGVRGLKESLAAAAQKFVPDRTVLPIPDKTFGGVAGRTLKESVADWSMIPGPSAPEGAPNVLLVLIDDAGFGAIDTFGGPVATPNFSRVRKMGITYNAFHVTAVCSPTRAATLTGRNQHRVGFGSIAEYPGPFPGYTAAKPRSCAALPRILKENGYVTGGFGKWHLTPNNVQGAAGPFDHWPKAWGFDRWWGFLSGAAGQYDPIITQDDAVIGVPTEGKDGGQYYFPDDITDKSIEWLHGIRAQDQDKPWFLFYSTGCAHAPHHVAKVWADRYKGRFDDGWDKLRERTLQRQKELGIVPPDTQLTPRPDAFPAWDSLDDTSKKLYARQMEVYCGYQENADWNVGRLLNAIEELGDLDDTLIFWIWGDNGASLEGTVTGSFNELTFLNGLMLDPKQQTELIEKYGGLEALGGDHTAPHCAAAWAHAANTPFQWGKQDASHLGGTRDPMVVAWPSRIRPSAELRRQFTHCIDIAPTVLEAAGLPEPKTVDGIEQEPIDGTSFLYTFDDPKAAERHTTQYFEMFAGRGMYKDGWWAASRPDRLPWDLSPETLAKFGPDADWDPDRDVGWELYYLPDDFSQARDIAAEHPDKVKELQELWWKEAERNRVLPLMAGFSVIYGILPPLPTQTRFPYRSDVQNVMWGMIPRIYGRSYSIEADLLVPDGSAEGVIVAMADFIGGFGLWVDGDGMLQHTYSLLGVDTYKQTATKKLPTGDVNVKMLFESKEPKPGSGGHVTLYVNDEVVGEGDIPRTVPITFTSYAGMDIGRDNGLVVDLAYEDKAPYAFTGTIKQVVFDLKPAHHEAEKELHRHGVHETVAAGVAG
jgi:arylsulfatase A-like enzyme/uncharacterized membrane protein